MAQPLSSRTKLSAEGRNIVFRMYAEGNKIPDIVKYLDENNHSRPGARALSVLVKNACNQPAIEKYRRIYYSKITEVPIANKRARLDVIQKTVDTLKATMDKMIKADGSVKDKEFNKVMTLIKRVDDMLSNAHNEMEQRPGALFELTQNFGDTALTDEEVIVEERNILTKIAEFERAGISFTDRGVSQLTEPEIS